MFAAYRSLAFNSWQSIAFAMLRVVSGRLFSFHGMQKILGGYGNPVTGGGLRMAAGYIELIGGLLIMVGLFTSVTAFIASGEMAFAYFMSHFPRGFWPVQNGGELAALYCFLFLFFFTTGAGAYSLDRLLFGSRASKAEAARLSR
ncbi:MAG: DoxX family protein [Candidatus Korobacteraceae bacterium]